MSESVYMYEGERIYLVAVLLIKTLHEDVTWPKGFCRKSVLTRQGLTNSVQHLTNKLKILIVLSHVGLLHEVSITFKVKPPTKCVL